MEHEFSDDDDGQPLMKKKKKRKRPRHGCHDAPPPPSEKMGSLKPKVWPIPLPPFKRMLWEEEANTTTTTITPEGSKDAQALRKRLGLRVPEVRKLPCRFWLNGNCARGDACSFAHTVLAADVPSSASSPNAAAAAAARCPPPVESLTHPGLPRLIGRGMLHCGFREPSPIQAQAWPAALRGHDLLCRAPTGSGKTLAYLLPAIAHAHAAKPPPPPGGGPVALVLLPTRELAMQVGATCRSLRKPCGVKVEAVYGGEPREEQVEALETGGLHVLVATTGRLVDLLMTRQASVGRVTLLVLDEADQLLALGFSLQINQILSQLRPDRQTLLFSATLNQRLEEACATWLKQPMRVYADERRGGGGGQEDEDEAEDEADEGEAAAQKEEMEVDEDDTARDGGGGGGGFDEEMAAAEEQLSAIPTSVEQRFVACERDGRAAALVELLSSIGFGVGRNPPRVMVFVNEIKQLKKLSLQLRSALVRCEVLHGERSQREREDSLARFKAGAAPVLLTTDLASRGIDIRKLPAVINFDPPTNAIQYVHRAGRTGRQGEKGLVVTFLRRDAASRHFAMQVSGMLQRTRGSLPMPAEIVALVEGRAGGGATTAGAAGAAAAAAAAAAGSEEKPAKQKKIKGRAGQAENGAGAEPDDAHAPTSPAADALLGGDLLAFASSFA